MPFTMWLMVVSKPCNSKSRRYKLTQGSLSELKLKKGVLIAAIIRNGKAIFPNGDDHLMVGDRIVVTTLIQNVNKIYDLLER